jgi:site-specific recombinase XerC
LIRYDGGDGPSVALGHELIDAYLGFVAARARPNTLLATAYDLKVFFAVAAKDPAAVTTSDVLGFIAQQRRPRRGGNVVRLEDGERGLSARTIKRRLSSVSGLYAYLVTRDDVAVTANPVPRGLATRAAVSQRRGVPLIRALGDEHTPVAETDVVQP